MKWVLWTLGVLLLLLLAANGLGELLLLAIAAVYFSQTTNLHDVGPSRRSIDVAALILCLVAILFIPPALAAFFVLLLGWMGFLARVAPRIATDPVTVCVACVTVVGFVAGMNILLRLYKEPTAQLAFDAKDSDATPINSPTHGWKLRWSFAILAVAFLMFVSGLAAVGILESGRSIWELRR